MAKSAPPPSVNDIPAAHQLQAQLGALNQAIAILSQSGAALGGVRCMPPPSSNPDIEPPEPANVTLDPPLTDPNVIHTLVNTMQQHATAIEQELAAMGYATA